MPGSHLGLFRIWSPPSPFYRTVVTLIHVLSARSPPIITLELLTLTSDIPPILTLVALEGNMGLLTRAHIPIVECF